MSYITILYLTSILFRYGYGFLKNFRLIKNPTSVVIPSVTGYVSQKYLSPNLENKYPSGTNRKTVRIIVSHELFILCPTA